MWSDWSRHKPQIKSDRTMHFCRGKADMTLQILVHTTDWQLQRNTLREWEKKYICIYLMSGKVTIAANSAYILYLLRVHINIRYSATPFHMHYHTCRKLRQSDNQMCWKFHLFIWKFYCAKIKTHCGFLRSSERKCLQGYSKASGTDSNEIARIY